MGKKHGNILLEQTPTTVCCGVFSLRVGVRLVSVLTAFEGACQLYVYLSETLSGEPVFRWGPAAYERHLQLSSAVVGCLAILSGFWGAKSARSCNHKVVHNVRLFQLFFMCWTVIWFALVGMPVRIDYVSVPVVDRWPISALPGIPKHLVVDPQWPDGKPAVCGDIADIKARLVESLESKQKNRFLRTTLRKVSVALLKKVLTCQQTVKVFWSCGALLLAFRFYCIHILGYFFKVILRGGDGVMIMGRLDDLDEPFSASSTSLVLMRKQVQQAFNEMDADGDGRLSFEELMQYLEDSNHRYKGISKALGSGDNAVKV